MITQRTRGEDSNKLDAIKRRKGREEIIGRRGVGRERQTVMEKSRRKKVLGSTG